MTMLKVSCFKKSLHVSKDEKRILSFPFILEFRLPSRSTLNTTASELWWSQHKLKFHMKGVSSTMFILNFPKQVTLLAIECKLKCSFKIFHLRIIKKLTSIILEKAIVILLRIELPFFLLVWS